MATTKKETTSTSKPTSATAKPTSAAVKSASTSAAAKSVSTSATVGRQELTRRISQQTKISQKQAAEVLEATLDAIQEALQKGDEVRLVGFGSFKVRQSAARRGVNPRDRQPIQVPAKERVRFFPGKELAESVLKK